MKKLPENPSLSHLRQQAKDLHSEIRTVTPDASLADAQVALAEQYGFRSWTDLKAEAERRRAAIECADPALAHAIAETFALGDVVAPMLPVERGAMSRAWSLETDRGRWSISELFKWVRLDAVAAGVTLLEAAIAAGVKAPKPVRSKRDDVVQAVDGKNWRVYEWMTFGPAPSKPVGTAAAAAMGRTLATLHGLALDAPGEVSPWLTSRVSEENWRRLAGAAQAPGASWAPALTAAIPALVDVATIASGGDEPAILCHCDLTPGNVRMAGHDAVVVLDWENAGALPPRWELGYVLAQWAMAPGDQVNDAAVRALVDAYRDGGGMTGELDLSMFAASISAAQNWTSSRVLRALNGDDAGEQKRAIAELPGLLAHPVSRERLERVLSAIG